MWFNIESIDWNVVAAGVSAIGTMAAAWAAFASRSTSGKALQLQNRLYLYESLKASAERANVYSNGKKGIDWGFHDAANIVRSLSLAMTAIEQHSGLKNVDEIRELKWYFVSLLNMELFTELNNSNAPDAIFKGTVTDSTGVEVWNSWLLVQKFFEFKFVTDDDLAD